MTPANDVLVINETRIREVLVSSLGRSISYPENFRSSQSLQASGVGFWTLAIVLYIPKT